MQPAPSPVANERLKRVHQAVHQLMSEQGFRISMEAVALRAGCSKQTLYTHFGSKQALIRSVIHEHLDLSTARLKEYDGDLRATLVAFCVEHLERISDPSVVSSSQLLCAEARIFPDEARALYREGCEKLQERIADWLAAAMRRGQLRHDDPHIAAELFMGMMIGLDFERQRFNVPHRDGDAARRAWAGFAVDAFLRAFAPAATTLRHPTAAVAAVPES